jgi:TP901 family phage tail tape measure protein
MAGIRADVNLNVNTSQAKRSMDRAAAEINKVVNGIGGKQVSFNVNSRSFTQPLGRINASANEFTKSLEASNARVIAFGASVGIINGISDAFKGLVAETIKFEKVLTDINVVLNTSSQSLERFGRGLFDVAKNTAQSFSVASEAALEFSRQGLTMEEVLKRTNDALTLTRLTGLKAEEAVSGLTAAVNAFGSAGLSTTDIIDKLAAVDVKFAVSSEDLINALERTGAVAIDAGVEIDNLIGLVAALQQTTARGGAVIGNGLKTIFTRIQRPESIRQLEEMGLAVRDLSGAILPADRLMLGMAKSFDKLTQSQQSNIVQFSAGIFQANIFRAALRDLGKEQSIQAQATEIAGNASGDAAKKNEILNKTMSAMASQTVTSIQELAETIGKLTLTPEIGGLLSFLQDGIEGIRNMLGGGEDKGSDFAKGLVRGIGNVLTGPAAVAFGAIFIKLFVNIAKFASGSLKDVLGIVSQKDKIKQMEESITKALSENLKIQEGLNNLEGDRKAQEQFILGIIEQQNQAMAEQARLASRLAKPLVQSGINPDFSQSRKTASSGVVPESAREEVQGAAKGGYKAGKIDSMNIPGMGEVVYNKAEKVKRFPGMKQPAIMPPQQSRAGRNYKDAFAGQHGFDPYASGGFVPNFARMQGSKLVLDKSLTKLSANPGSARTTDEIRKSYIDLVASGQPVNVEATMSQLLGNSGRGHSEKVKEVLQFLQQEAGVAAVSRQFDLKKLPFRGRKSDTAAEAAVLKKEGKGFFSTGGRSGDPTFPVDLVGLGMRPIEVKSGEWKLPNVLMKSMRLYSDDGLMEFAKNFGASEELISGARGEKFKKGSKLLMKKKLLAKDSTHEQKHQSLLDYRLSAGFVPNFTKKKAGSNYGSDADLLRDIIEDLGASEKYKYNSLKDITAAYSSRLSGTKESFTTKLSRFRNGTPGQRQGISDKEAIKLTGFLKTKVKLGQTGKRPKMYNDIDDKIIDDMINGNIDPVGAARKHGHGSGGGKDPSIIKQFKIQLKKAGKDEAHKYVSNYGKKDDDFKEDRELSTHLGLSFQKGGRKPNIDIPAGAVDNQKLKEIGLGLSGKTTNWEAKRSLQHLRGKGIRQMLFEHRNKQGGLFDIIKSFDSKNPGKKEARAIDITEQFGGALAIPGTRGKNYPTGAAMQLSTFTWKAMDKIFKAKFGRNEELAKQNKSIAADIMAEEYSLASRGFIPNYAVNLSNGYHDKRSIGKAISSVYKSKTGKQMGRKDVDFSIERYISAIKDKQIDDGKNFVSNYPGGNFSVGGQKFNFNEISMALLKHGHFIEGQNKGLVPNFADLSKSKRIKNFQGEYEDLAKMGSPLAKWALKTVKDKEFKMIGHGMESWAIGNEEVVYKLPRPQINSFNGSGDLELERWRRQMKVMAQPSLQYKVSPENKAWNLVPNSNIAKRAERIRSQLDSSGIDSLFLPNTEVLKVAGQDEFITSQERVKGSTFLNLQDEILKSKKNKTDFNTDGYRIVDHLMENISETGMIRDVHSGNFIAEASKKKQLLNTVNQFAPIGSKESKPLSKLGLRGLPDDSIAAIDFSSGLIPNFANVNLYRGQKNKTLDVPNISESLPSFASARTPNDVVAIVQDFVKRHVSGDLSGYRNKQGISGEKKASGASSFSTSPQVADNFANSIDLDTNDMSKGQVFQKTVPSKNIFNKAKLLKILNKGSDPKRGDYPSVEKFKKEIASGAVKNWFEKNGGLYLNISGVNNDPSSGKRYGQSMKQIVPHADVGYNKDRTRQIHQGEREVIQLFNNGLVPNFSRVEQVQKSQKRRVREQITEGDKDLAHNIFDYLKTNISNLSSRFRFNRSTVSFGGNPEDYEKVFNHSSSRKNRENLIEIARSEMKMNRILKGFMIPHSEGSALARKKYKAPRDPFLGGAMHDGLVPNFANPLGDAVSREKAAGVPSSRIRIEKSNELKSPQNPMGLAVTNTRDEPMGVSQGIKRAKSMGIDPKKHGASSGLIPNFVDYGPGMPAPKIQGPTYSDIGIKKEKKARDESTKSIKENAAATDKSTDSSNQDSMQSMMNLQRLFLFQSGLSMANGFLEQFAKEGSSATKTLAELGMAATNITGSYIQQKTVVNELMESFEIGRDKAVGVFDLGSSKSKAGRGKIGKGLTQAISRDGGKGFSGFMSGIKMAGKGLLRFTPIIGQLYTGFTVLNEVVKMVTGGGIMDYFASETTKAAKRLEKLSESSEKLSSALQNAQKVEDQSVKITELELLAGNRTNKQELELLNLKSSQIKSQSALASSISALSGESKHGKEVAAEFSKAMETGASMQETMNKILKAQIKIQATTSLTELASGIEKKLENQESLSGQRNVISGAALSASILMSGMDAETRKSAMADSGLRGVIKEESNERIMGGSYSFGASTPSFNPRFLELFSRKLNESIDNQGKINQTKKEELKVAKNLEAEIKKTVLAQKSGRKQTEFIAKITAQRKDLDRKRFSFERDILSEYGGILSSAKVENDSADKLAKIQEDYNNKVEIINNKALQQSQDALLKRLKEDATSIDKLSLDPELQLRGESQGFKEEDFGLSKAQAKLANQKMYQISQEKELGEKTKILQGIKDTQILTALKIRTYEGVIGSKAVEEIHAAEEILKAKQNNLELEKESKKAQEQSVEQERIRALISKKTVEGAFELQEILAGATPYADEAIAAMRGNAAILKEINDFRKIDLQKILESSALIEEANETQIQKNATDTLAAKKSLELKIAEIKNFQKNKQLREFNFKLEVATQKLTSKELKERLEIFSKTKDYKDLMTKKLEDEIAQAGLAERDAQIKNEFYNIEKNRIDLVTKQTNAEILNLNTTNLINQEKIKQLAEQGKITQLVAAQINQSKLSAKGDLQVAREKFQQTGSAEDGVALAQAMTNLNKEFGNNTRGADMLREKLAELSEKSANLSADLVNIGFDQTRSGLKDLFKSIGSGAKSASEAWSDFGLNMADTLLDRIMEHNVDQMVSNLSTAFFGQDLLKDSNLLLRDSNLILKDSIDLNTAALSAQASVPFRQYAKGGFVDGPAGVDKVPAMLTAGEYVIPKDQASQLKQGGGLIQYFRDGTGTKGAKAKKEKSRIMRGIEGVSQSIVMSEVSRAVGKRFSKKNAEASESPPVFDKNKLNNLDLKSDVNIKRGDPRLSARLLTKDPVMQEYKDYLLEKAAYDVRKNNERVDKKMQTIGSIVGTVASIAAAQLSEVAKPYITKGVRASENFAKGTLGFGKHAEDYRAAKHKGLNVDYRAIKEGYRSGEIISNDNVVYNFDDLSKNEYKTEMHRARGDIEKSIAINNKWSRKGKAIHRQSGGSIPAMLTAGEGFVPAPIAKRIGYENLSRMNTTGELPIVQGKGGVDNVGPVGLTEGDFIIKKSSTDKLLRDNPNMMRFALQNPDGFKRGESGYYEGGIVGKTSAAPSPSMAKASPVNRISNVEQVEMINQPINQRPQASTEVQKVGETTNNINVNVTIDQAGAESVSTDSSAGSYEEEQQLSLKIKSAVLDVIRQEKRIGGELSS